ncbi:hypothetical protein FBD94_24485 [Pedobacter hiemivivus]|uniref:Uncharacterized protein n=1 Tax=Pedobacter hiemivivus TaxID=2530454 RepID=A0A4V5PBI1_9SPHI|nr:hypothetical protein [Pedobacter hiemivivus]TKC55806.1 hypothetical protein FBD94_24485 [Pedobacter hiemivivus]
MLKFLKPVVLIALLASVALISCEKGTIPTADPSGALDAEKIKFQKMKKFVSIAWDIPLNEVLFDATNDEFSFGKNKMTKDEIENLYDISNEYKAKYETN